MWMTSWTAGSRSSGSLHRVLLRQLCLSTRSRIGDDPLLIYGLLGRLVPGLGIIGRTRPRTIRDSGKVHWGRTDSRTKKGM